MNHIPLKQQQQSSSQRTASAVNRRPSSVVTSLDYCRISNDGNNNNNVNFPATATAGAGSGRGRGGHRDDDDCGRTTNHPSRAGSSSSSDYNGNNKKWPSAKKKSSSSLTPFDNSHSSPLASSSSVLSSSSYSSSSPTKERGAIWKTLKQAKERQEAIRTRVRSYSSDDPELDEDDSDDRDITHNGIDNSSHQQRRPNNFEQARKVVPDHAPSSSSIQKRESFEKDMNIERDDDQKPLTPEDAIRLVLERNTYKEDSDHNNSDHDDEVDDGDKNPLFCHRNLTPHLPSQSSLKSTTLAPAVAHGPAVTSGVSTRPSTTSSSGGSKKIILTKKKKKTGSASGPNLEQSSQYQAPSSSTKLIQPPIASQPAPPSRLIHESHSSPTQRKNQKPISKAVPSNSGGDEECRPLTSEEAIQIVMGRMKAKNSTLLVTGNEDEEGTNTTTNSHSRSESSTRSVSMGHAATNGSAVLSRVQEQEKQQQHPINLPPLQTTTSRRYTQREAEKLSQDMQPALQMTPTSSPSISPTIEHSKVCQVPHLTKRRLEHASGLAQAAMSHPMLQQRKLHNEEQIQHYEDLEYVASTMTTVAVADITEDVIVSQYVHHDELQNDQPQMDEELIPNSMSRVAESTKVELNRGDRNHNYPRHCERNHNEVIIKRNHNEVIIMTQYSHDDHEHEGFEGSSSCEDDDDDFSVSEQNHRHMHDVESLSPTDSWDNESSALDARHVTKGVSSRQPNSSAAVNIYRGDDEESHDAFDDATGSYKPSTPISSLRGTKSVNHNKAETGGNDSFGTTVTSSPFDGSPFDRVQLSQYRHDHTQDHPKDKMDMVQDDSVFYDAIQEHSGRGQEDDDAPTIASHNKNDSNYASGWNRFLSPFLSGSNEDEKDEQEPTRVPADTEKTRASRKSSMSFGMEALSSSVSMLSSAATSIGRRVTLGLDGTAEHLGPRGSIFTTKVPKNPPKNTKIASRELEIIKKCQEQIKVREIEEAEKRANAAKLDEENMRLEREEEAERARVTAEVEAYRQMMQEMGEEDKLAPEDMKKAAEEYDDRLAMADTLQEQEAKAKLAQKSLAKVDKGATPGGDETDESAASEYEAACCCCVS